MKKPKESPTGWWVAGLLEKHVAKGSAVYWENLRLVRAENWRIAFGRAEEMGGSDARIGNHAFGNDSEFIGITDLVPVYDNFEDGAELLWKDHGESAPLDENGEVAVFSAAELASIYDD